MCIKRLRNVFYTIWNQDITETKRNINDIKSCWKAKKCRPSGSLRKKVVAAEDCYGITLWRIRGVHHAVSLFLSAGAARFEIRLCVAETFQFRVIGDMHKRDMGVILPDSKIVDHRRVQIPQHGFKCFVYNFVAWNEDARFFRVYSAAALIFFRAVTIAL